MASPATPGLPDALPALPRPEKSIEQLAAEQGVGLVPDLDEISALWPVNDDPDELDAFLAAERTARRAAAQGKPASG